jgi:hypothetical protein
MAFARQDACLTLLASRILISCSSRQHGQGTGMIVPSAGTITDSHTATMTATPVTGQLATNLFIQHERFVRLRVPRPCRDPGTKADFVGRISEA